MLPILRVILLWFDVLRSSRGWGLRGCIQSAVLGCVGLCTKPCCRCFVYLEMLSLSTRRDALCKVDGGPKEAVCLSNIIITVARSLSLRLSLPTAWEGCLSQFQQRDSSQCRLGWGQTCVACHRPDLSGCQDVMAPIVAEACLAVMPPLPSKASVSVEHVRVCKLLGGSAADSHVVHGMVVSRDAEVMHPQASLWRKPRPICAAERLHHCAGILRLMIENRSQETKESLLTRLSHVFVQYHAFMFFVLEIISITCDFLARSRKISSAYLISVSSFVFFV